MERIKYTPDQKAEQKSALRAGRRAYLSVTIGDGTQRKWMHVHITKKEALRLIEEFTLEMDIVSSGGSCFLELVEDPQPEKPERERGEQGESLPPVTCPGCGKTQTVNCCLRGIFA